MRSVLVLLRAVERGQWAVAGITMVLGALVAVVLKDVGNVRD